jgi:hypothetical protein
MCLTRTYDGFIFTETVPTVVVFTKYDRLVLSKKRDLEEDNVNLGPEELERRGTEEAQKVLDTCIQSVENAFLRLGLGKQRIRYVNISSMFSRPSISPISIDLSLVEPGYEASISSLVEATRDVVQEQLKGDAWVAWAIAQHANLPLKIQTCIE